MKAEADCVIRPLASAYPQCQQTNSRRVNPKEVRQLVSQRLSLTAM
jgi:hypothetical protein